MWYKNTIDRYLENEERKATIAREERIKFWNETIKPLISGVIKSPGGALCAIPIIFIINPGIGLLLMVFVPILIALWTYNALKYAFDPNS
jgi:hypothetical protein